MSVTTMTLRVPDDIAPSIRAAASEAGLSVNTYVVRAARRHPPASSATDSRAPPSSGYPGILGMTLSPADSDRSDIPSPRSAILSWPADKRRGLVAVVGTHEDDETKTHPVNAMAFHPAIALLAMGSGEYDGGSCSSAWRPAPPFAHRAPPRPLGPRTGVADRPGPPCPHGATRRLERRTGPRGRAHRRGAPRRLDRRSQVAHWLPGRRSPVWRRCGRAGTTPAEHTGEDRVTLNSPTGAHRQSVTSPFSAAGGDAGRRHSCRRTRELWLVPHGQFPDDDLSPPLAACLRCDGEVPCHKCLAGEEDPRADAQ